MFPAQSSATVVAVEVAVEVADADIVDDTVEVAVEVAVDDTVDVADAEAVDDAVDDTVEVADSDAVDDTVEDIVEVPVVVTVEVPESDAVEDTVEVADAEAVDDAVDDTVEVAVVVISVQQVAWSPTPAVVVSQGVFMHTELAEVSKYSYPAPHSAVVTGFGFGVCAGPFLSPHVVNGTSAA